MLLLLCTILVVVLLIGVGKWFDRGTRYDGTATLLIGLGGITFFILFIELVLIVPYQFEGRALIARVEAIRATPHGSEAESTAWRMAVAKTNGDIAEAKMYRASFPLWWPSEIETLQPIDTSK